MDGWAIRWGDGYTYGPVTREWAEAWIRSARESPATMPEGWEPMEVIPWERPPGEPEDQGTLF